MPAKKTRKYVFLAEVLTGKAADLAVSSGEVAGSATIPLPVPGNPDGRTGQTSGLTGAIAVPPFAVRQRVLPESANRAKTSDKALERMSGMSARVAAKAALESATKSSRSRRKLDPLELGAERDPVLRASTELLTLPSSAPQQRASAAALWQALETDVARMLVQSRLTDEGGPDLRVQLEQSRSERFSNWQVYALAALLLLTWLVTAYLWT